MLGAPEKSCANLKRLGCLHGGWESRILLPGLQKETWKGLEDRKTQGRERETEACRRTGFLSMLSDNRGDQGLQDPSLAWPFCPFPSCEVQSSGKTKDAHRRGSLLPGGEVGGSFMSVLCMAQGRTQPGHTAGEHLGLASSRPHGWWISGSVPFAYVGRSSGLCVAQWSAQSPHKQQLIPSEHVLACPTNEQTGPLCPAGGTVCATRDLWLAKRLLNKGNAPVQVSVAAPAKDGPWARVDSEGGLRGVSMQGSMLFLPAWESVLP